MCCPRLSLPSFYVDKAGADVLGQMYAFTDRKGRELCLRPEGTATSQLLARGPLARQTRCAALVRDEVLAL